VKKNAVDDETNEESEWERGLAYVHKMKQCEVLRNEEGRTADR